MIEAYIVGEFDVDYGWVDHRIIGADSRETALGIAYPNLPAERRKAVLAGEDGEHPGDPISGQAITVRRCNEADPFVSVTGVADLSLAEYRAIGWHDEDESSCDTCGLCDFDMDEFRVCQHCNLCPECRDGECEACGKGAQAAQSSGGGEACAS